MPRTSMLQHVRRTSTTAALVVLSVAGCETQKDADPAPQPPNVAPETRQVQAAALQLNADDIQPMYNEVLGIDLPTVLAVASAQNFDIRRARESVHAAEGQYESAIGAAFPAIVPGALFQRRDGSSPNSDGRVFQVGFQNFQAAIAIDWVINPGRVIFDIVAAQKRLYASEQQEDAVLLETLRLATNQFYELALAQVDVSTVHRSVLEAEELVRITKLQVRTGTGVPADRMRADARLAERQQDLISAMNRFYEASVDLALTLHLDAAVTLIPSMDELPPLRLVSDDVSVDVLLDCAVEFRPDMESVREVVEVISAERGSVWWSGFGPEFATSYEYGTMWAHANNVENFGRGIPPTLIVNPFSPTGAFAPNPVVNGFIREGIARGSRELDGPADATFGFKDFHLLRSGVAWRLTLSAFGDLRTADARLATAVLDSMEMIDQVRAQVVRAQQASRINRELINLAARQVSSAEEALRLTETNLRAGTMTSLDVLQAEDAVNQARLRHARAVVRFNQSQVNLLAALGLLDQETLLGQDTEA